MPEEVQNTQYPMAARIDANKDGVSNLEWRADTST